MADVREVPADGGVGAVLAELCAATTPAAACCLVLVVGCVDEPIKRQAGLAVAHAAHRAVPTLGSLMRDACLQAGAAAEALLGEWGASVAAGGVLLLSLPPQAQVAAACLGVVAPLLAHAVGEASAGRASLPLR